MRRCLLVLSLGALLALSAGAASSSAAPPKLPQLVQETLTGLESVRSSLSSYLTALRPMAYACRAAASVPARARPAAKRALAAGAAPFKSRINDRLGDLVSLEGSIAEIADLADGLTGAKRAAARNVHHALDEAKGDLVQMTTASLDTIRAVTSLSCPDAADGVRKAAKHGADAQRWLRDAAGHARAL